MKKEITPENILSVEMPIALTADDCGKSIFFQFRVIKNNAYCFMIRQYNLVERRWDRSLEGRMPSVSHGGDKLFYIGKDQKAYIRDLQKEKDFCIGEFKRISGVSWERDDSRIIFTAAVKQEYEPNDLPILKKSIWIDRMKFKTDEEGVFDGTYREVIIYDIESKSFFYVSEGKRDISCPCFIEKDRIAYLGIPYEPDNSDEYHIYIRNLKEGTVETYKGPGGPITRLTVSHNREKIAMIAHDNRFWEATNFCIYSFDINEKRLTCLTDDYDMTFGNCVDSDTGMENFQYSLFWDEKDEWIYAPAVDGYSVNLYKVNALNGTVSNVVKDRAVIFATCKTENGVLMIRSKETCLAEIVYADFDGETEVLWQDEMSSNVYEMTESRLFYYQDCENRERIARCFLPVGKIKGMILNIHGGPHYCYGYDFSFDIQLLATYGYGTVICNPSGSQGSGQIISKSSYHDWGGKDFQELMACVEKAKQEYGLEKIPWGVMGGSYGGFMTNWIIGHTDIFSCALSERSTCNRYSQAGTSDCAFRYGMYEFDGYAWENPEHYMKHSPISYVKNVHTPVLILHGDKDMNCPISQSEEWYSALKLEGKEAYFAIFPGQYHDFKGKGDPQIREERYRLLLWWFGRYFVED